MSGNVTGGIVLFLVGAVIIAMGVSDKGKEIFNILMNGSSGTSTSKDEYPETGLGDGEEQLIDSPVKETSNGYFGFAGEKGADILNG